MGTKSNKKSNRKRNKSLRLSHSGIHRNKRTSGATRRTARRITRRLSIRNKPRFILPIIDDGTISSKNPSNSSSETSTVILDILDDNGLARGKTRTRKNRRHRRGKRSQRGGICYGNGVGANSYDPNFSIYNTRELELFPYKPT